MRTMRGLCAGLLLFIALTMPSAAFATEPEWFAIFHLKLAYHTAIASEHADWDFWATEVQLFKMNGIIALKDPEHYCSDVNGCVLFDLNGSVETFDDATFYNPNRPDNPTHYENVDSETKKNDLIDTLTWNYKIVDQINTGHGEFGESGIGADGIRSSIVDKQAREDTWVHEFGHNQDMRPVNPPDGHRPGCNEAIMYPSTTALVRDKISQAERTVFMSNPNETNSQRCGANTPGELRYLVAYMDQGSVLVRFRTERESEVEGFKLYRRPSPTDTVSLITTFAPQGGDVSVEYTFSDATGAVGNQYYLIEDRYGAPDISLGECVAVDSIHVVYTEPAYFNSDSLSAIITGGDPVEVETLFPCEFPVLPAYAIIGPDSFAVNLTMYANIWRDRGIDARYIPVSYADSCYGGVSAYIRHAAAAGMTYALLVGDASDDSLWDSPSAWNYPGWTYPMDACGEGHAPGDSLKNVLPTYYFPYHNEPYRYSMTYWTPYYSSDLPYSDINNDGLPDIALGRLPVANNAEIVAYASKLLSFLSEGNTIHHTCYQLGYAVDAAPAASGIEAQIGLEQVANTVPTGVSLSRYYARGPWNNRQVVKTGALSNAQNDREAGNLAANHEAGVIVWQTTSSDRYQWIGWNLFSGWSVDQLSPNHRPFVSLNLSCGMVSYDMCEYSDWTCAYEGRIRPIAERVLLNPNRGAIVVIGPTRGSLQVRTAVFGAALLPKLFQYGMNVGNAFNLAYRSCLTKYPEYRDQFREMVLLGDPMIGATTLDASGVREGKTVSPSLRIVSARPNPFNGQLEAVINAGFRSRVRVSIFNVAGRLVRNLGEFDAGGTGTISVRWDGSLGNGRPAASGVYFVTAKSGVRTSTARVVLMR
jgi:peptidase C25-like protein